MITWDEKKRQRNIRERGFDFADAEAIFEGPVMTEEDRRVAYNELRINLIGILRGVVVFMTYTERDDNLHIISLRQATRYETRKFARWISHHT